MKSKSIIKQRAEHISQSKPGYIYILSNESLKKNLYKIGYTTRSPEERAEHLYKKMSGVPAKFVVEYKKYCSNPALAEIIIHNKLKPYRTNIYREFFEIELKEAIRIIELHTTVVDVVEKQEKIGNKNKPESATKKNLNPTKNRITDVLNRNDSFVPYKEKSNNIEINNRATYKDKLSESANTESPNTSLNNYTQNNAEKKVTYEYYKNSLVALLSIAAIVFIVYISILIKSDSEKRLSNTASKYLNSNQQHIEEKSLIFEFLEPVVIKRLNSEYGSDLISCYKDFLSDPIMAIEFIKEELRESGDENSELFLKNKLTGTDYEEEENVSDIETIKYNEEMRIFFSSTVDSLLTPTNPEILEQSQKDLLAGAKDELSMLSYSVLMASELDHLSREEFRYLINYALRTCQLNLK